MRFEKKIQTSAVNFGLPGVVAVVAKLRSGETIALVKTGTPESRLTALTIICPNMHCKAAVGKQCHRGLFRSNQSNWRRFRAIREPLVHLCRERKALEQYTTAFR